MNIIQDIAIIGAGGFGREVKMLIDDINNVTETYNFKGYYDDGLEAGTILNGYKVLGGLKELNSLKTPIQIAVAVGNPCVKNRILSSLDNDNITFPILIHPTVVLNKDVVEIEQGSIICAGSILTCNIKIGEFVIINLMCTIGHDAVVKKMSSLMPSVNISGEVTVNESVYIGTGAKVINQLEIGQNTIVGAGAVVSKSIPANCTAVGIPAKIIKLN